MFLIYINIYNVIIYLIQPIIWIRLLWKSIKISEYRKKWLERYGYYYFHKIQTDSIVIHAVSVGEILSAKPIVHALQNNYPDTVITLTSMTPSGLKLLVTLKSIEYKNNDKIQCFYLPYDLPGSMKRFINTFQPKLVVVMETEIWPNLINMLYKKKIPFIILNGRLSIRSFTQYKKMIYFFSLIMNRVSLVIAQNKENALRFIRLGLNQKKIHIINNLKFNIIITHNLKTEISFLKKNWTQGRLTWMAGSTHDGEEKLLLKVYKQLLITFPNLLLILAPRHPERFNTVINITKCLGFSYTTIKNNQFMSSIKHTQIIINDTIGKLMLLYGISDIAFIGGSLIKNVGGHNPLEPAIYSLPLVSGPHTNNFHDIYTELNKLNGLIKITDYQSLMYAISRLLFNQKLRSYYGNQAFKIFKDKQVSMQKLLKIFNNYLST